MERDAIHAELERVRLDFHELLDAASPSELRAGTDGTKWNNRQLLFHMLFGYLLVRVLLVIVRGFGRLPDAVSRTFAAVLNAGTRPFHVVNYVGSLGGGRVLGRQGMGRLMDRVVASLHSQLRKETDARLARGMHLPVGWDPYFTEFMTLLEVFHYPTQHYDHHRRQLTTQRARRDQDLGSGL